MSKYPYPEGEVFIPTPNPAPSTPLPEQEGTLMAQSNGDELREKLIEIDGELWDYQLDRLVEVILADRKQHELDARIDEYKRARDYFSTSDAIIYSTDRYVELKTERTKLTGGSNDSIER